MVNLSKYWPTAFQSGYNNVYSTLLAIYSTSCCPMFSPILGFLFCFLFYHSDGILPHTYPNYIFTFHFPAPLRYWVAFHRFLAISIFFFVSRFSSLLPYFYWIVFFSLIFRTSLCILGTSSLLVVSSLPL